MDLNHLPTRISNRLNQYPSYWNFVNHKFNNDLKEWKSVRKIVYLMAPSPKLRNVGDQAQAVAIRSWFAKHYSEFPVLEINDLLPVHKVHQLAEIINSDDIVFLHSGGNLGDRYLGSEIQRREIIRTLPENRIVILPQTIFFSDNELGREQASLSSKVYSEHDALTLLARDTESERIAQEIFKTVEILKIPDFVLSTPPRAESKGNQIAKVLVCIRKDMLGKLSQHESSDVFSKINNAIPCKWELHDTNIDRDIPPEKRHFEFARMLDLFGKFDAVITNRFHGTIFSVLCRKPCVILETLPYGNWKDKSMKVKGSSQWFKDLPFVELANGLEEVSEVLSATSSTDDRKLPNWNDLYFDSLPKKLFPS